MGIFATVSGTRDFTIDFQPSYRTITPPIEISGPDLYLERLRDLACQENLLSQRIQLT